MTDLLFWVCLSAAGALLFVCLRKRTQIKKVTKKLTEEQRPPDPTVYGDSWYTNPLNPMSPMSPLHGNLAGAPMANPVYQTPPASDPSGIMESLAIIDAILEEDNIAAVPDTPSVDTSPSPDFGDGDSGGAGASADW